MKKIKRISIRKLLSLMLIIAVLSTNIKLNEFVVHAKDIQLFVTLYLIDNTSEQWIKNDDAVIELIDNTFGHDRYIMTQMNNTTWSVQVPENAYNITFNRYNGDKSIQWNSWSF